MFLLYSSSCWFFSSTFFLPWQSFDVSSHSIFSIQTTSVHRKETRRGGQPARERERGREKRKWKSVEKRKRKCLSGTKPTVNDRKWYHARQRQKSLEHVRCFFLCLTPTHINLSAQPCIVQTTIVVWEIIMIDMRMLLHDDRCRFLRHPMIEVMIQSTREETLLLMASPAKFY